MTEERQKRIKGVLSKRQENITIVLENVFDPHNISAVMRSCDAVGVQEIYVLTNRVPQHRKWGFRSSSSAAKWLTVHQFTDLEECLARVRNCYSSILTTHLASDSVSLYDLDLTQSIALVFGNEHSGRQFCDPAGGYDPIAEHQRGLCGYFIRSLPPEKCSGAL
jgi:tRNA (guanosine-2'-O-)-methyltransferase